MLLVPTAATLRPTLGRVCSVRVRCGAGAGAGALLPVMVWFHGGSNMGGSGDLQSNLPFYDGKVLCATGEPAVVRPPIPLLPVHPSFFPSWRDPANI